MCTVHDVLIITSEIAASVTVPKIQNSGACLLEQAFAFLQLALHMHTQY